MTEKEFFQRLTKGKGDFVQKFLDVLAHESAQFCLIGGLAVNAYAEPVVSLDLDVVVVTDKLATLKKILEKHFKVESFENSLNVSFPDSDLRIQIQTDPRYQAFLVRASEKTVLGYVLPVASIEDVLQGKIWAASDPKRRPSKRQKDIADILRLIEVNPELLRQVPEGLRKQLSI